MEMLEKKIGFVIPWFGWNIPGGAESELREVVLHLHEMGQPVEIITTCVEKFASDWNVNFYKPGLINEKQIDIRRFKVRKRDTKAFDAVNYKLINKIPISEDEENTFIKEMINSPDMYKYIEEHKDEYVAFVFIPYMFGTTYFGVKAAPEKAVLIPCFHDEAYFHMNIFKEMYSKVAGIIYNAAPEKILTEANYDLNPNVKQIVMGIGMDTSQTGDGIRFRKKYGINENFILYAGRKDVGKNVNTLLEYFDEYKKRNNNDIHLVLIGGGEMEIPSGCKDCVHDLGFVDIQDKYDAYAAATVLCQPSHNESFSLVIMESWLAKRPVLVCEECAVTTNFVKESNGGLWFKDYFDFEGAVNFYWNNIEFADLMGHNGREYVLNNFDWNVIVEKYMEYFRKII